MRNFKIYILLSLLPLVSNAQKIYDLKTCLQLGVERNYQIRITKNDQTIADNNATIGNAGYLPTVSLDAGLSGTVNDTKRYMNDESVLEYNGIHNSTSDAGINLSWMLFDGLQIQAKYDILKEFQRMGDLQTRLSIEDFIAGFSAEYYNYVRQQIRWANMKYAVDLSRERLRIVEARYNIGSMSRLDLQQARVDFNADSSNLIKQHEIVYRSRVRLNQLMAFDDVSQRLTVSDTAIIFNSLPDEKTLWSMMLNANTSLLMAAKEKRISDLDYKAIKSRNYPYLRLDAGYGFTQNKYEQGDYSKQNVMGFNYGLTLGFTIFDGFNRKREQKNAKLQIENKELLYEQLSLHLKANLSNIWMAYQNNIELTNLEKENTQTAKENYEIAIERYKLGSLSGIELREAQNSLLEAEERLVQAQYDTKLCEISLLQISGTIVDYLSAK